MKERTLILFFILLLISFVCFCDDLELMISCPKGEMVLGCPISIPTEIRNLSGKPITLSYKPLKFVKLETRDEEGKIVDIEPERRVLEMPGLDSQKIEIEANGKNVIATGVDYIKKAGKYTAKAIFESKGPYYYLENGKLVPFQAWEGRIESEICQFEVKPPTGIDLEAYNYFKGDPLSKPSELLQKYPTSTYAGYVACPPNQWTSNTAPERILKAIETGSYLSGGSLPDDTGQSKDGWLYLGGKDLIEWRAKWVGIVLKNHPDIWYADDLKLRLAVDQIALKNYQAAESDLDKLSKEAKLEVAEKAKKYLSLMKDKGWIKVPKVNEEIKEATSSNAIISSNESTK